MNNEPKTRDMGGILMSLFNLVGGVSGFLAIGLLIWRGGAIVQQVGEHERRIAVVEMYGTGSLAAHVKYDDERVTALKERTTRLENLLLAVPELQRDIAVVNVKVDALQKTLDAYIKRIAEEPKGK